ncbi:hypothetical protein GGF37_006742, partial [Kickxella alabastrina]
MKFSLLIVLMFTLFAVAFGAPVMKRAEGPAIPLPNAGESFLGYIGRILPSFPLIGGLAGA